jgi:solute:Na+ symporter, SSS family
MDDLKTTELIIFAALFLLVTVLGFVASRWRRAETLEHLDEWGLGGRNFGAWITWFLIGGDLYTAYTFVAVPALIYGAGALGFFAVPYTIVVYPMVFLVAVRLWSVSHRHGYVTPADFVRGRHGSSTLALMVALTGIVATMPYIALQLVGIEAVLDTIGLGSNTNWLVQDMPLFIAFAVLAAFTYSSGLRAPALIAFVKDALIYLVIVVAIIWVAVHIGFGDMFSAAKTKMDTVTPAGTPTGVFIPSSGPVGYWAYASLALGSALALFMYPHSITAVLSGKTRNTIRRNAAILPAYSFVLGLLALLGWVAIAAGTKPIGLDGKPNAQLVIPQLFEDSFPSWFAGVAFAAIAIGALVPAAIMSIAAANLWTRNIYKEYLKKDATPAQEAKQAKLASLVVKFGAVAFIVFIDPQFSIDLQLIGGVMILQTLPAVAIALYTRWFHLWGLIAGWVVGMGYGMWLLYNIGNPAVGKAHFAGSALPLDKLSLFGWHPFAGSAVQIYVGAVAVVANLLVAVIVTLIAKRARLFNGTDETQGDDYHVDEDSDRVKPVAVH